MVGSGGQQDVEVLVTRLLGGGDGVHELGTIEITYNSGGGSGTVNVTVSALVGAAASVHLPLVLR